MKKSDIVLVSFLLLVLVGLGYLFFLAPVSETGYRQVEVTGSEMTATAGPNLSYVDVDATIVQGAFVTIHESMGSAPGTIIGTSRYYEPGIYSNLSTNVTSLLQAGSTYIALLHVDDGDKVFVVDKDLPVTSNGQVVRWDFVAEPAQ